MTDKTVDISHTDSPRHTPAADDPRAGARNMQALELCFVLVLCVVVAAAFWEATTYQLVSSRTPFVIIVPLFALLVFQAFRLLGKGDAVHVKGALSQAMQGRIPMLNKLMVLSGWLVALLAAIIVAGHYIAMAAFVFILTRLIAKERLMLSLITTAVITLIIYAAFEIGFDIELYRGLVYRYWAGYRIF